MEASRHKRGLIRAHVNRARFAFISLRSSSTFAKRMAVVNFEKPAVLICFHWRALAREEEWGSLPPAELRAEASAALAAALKVALPDANRNAPKQRASA